MHVGSALSIYSYGGGGGAKRYVTSMSIKANIKKLTVFIPYTFPSIGTHRNGCIGGIGGTGITLGFCFLSLDFAPVGTFGVDGLSRRGGDLGLRASISAL